MERWTIIEGSISRRVPWQVYEGPPKPGDEGGIEVVPASEVERLRDALEKIARHDGSQEWREVAREALNASDDRSTVPRT